MTEVKKIRVLEMFSGVGAQATALENLGIEHECVTSEICKPAIAMYNAIHGDTVNLGDIAKIEHIPEGVDLLTYSFPCCPAGTMVMTYERGYIPIEEVEVGMYVLTHRNRFEPVLRMMSRQTDELYEIKATGLPTLRITKNHPLYVYRDGRFEWVKTGDLCKTDRLTVNIPKQLDCEIPDLALQEGMCWMLGRYVADGYINPRLYHSTEYAIGIGKADDFDAHVPPYMDGIKKCKSHATCYQYRLADKPFQDLCREFGNGAVNKCIPTWVFALPQDRLQEFFDGYISGDGHIREHGGSPEYMFSTTSHRLMLGMQAIVARLYGVQCTVSIRHDPRSETFNDSYNVQFVITDAKRPSQTIVDDKICIKINSIERFDTETTVYNMEVALDNSYTTENIIVHNCTDISIAGRQEGFAEGSGTRSSLLWEVGRLLEDAKERDILPEFLVMENVEAILAEKNLPHFKRWIMKLNRLGYDSSYAVMNAKDFGVPQNRKRVFMVSSLHHGKFIFEEGHPLDKRLKDILEDDVDESYYLSDEKIANYEAHAKRHEGKGNGYGWVFHTEDEVANTVVTHPSKGTTQTLLEDIDVVGDLHMKGTLEQHNRVHNVNGIAPTVTTVLESPIILEAGNLNNDTAFRRANVVLSGDGIAPTLTAEHVGINQPKVAVIDYPSNTTQGYMEAEEGDGLVMNRPTKARGTVQPQTAPTLTTGNGCGTGVVVKVSGVPLAEGVEDMVEDVAILTPKRTEYGKEVRKNYEAGLLDESRHNMVEFVPRDDGVSNTLTTVARDNILVEKEIVPVEEEGDVAAMHTPGRETKRQNGPRFRNDGTAFTLTTQDIDGVAKMEGGRLRIRYLTERECWRLQGFDDARIDRAFDVVKSKGHRY